MNRQAAKVLTGMALQNLADIMEGELAANSGTHFSSSRDRMRCARVIKVPAVKRLPQPRHKLDEKLEKTRDKAFVIFDQAKEIVAIAAMDNRAGVSDLALGVKKDHNTLDCKLDKRVTDLILEVLEVTGDASFKNVETCQSGHSADKKVSAEESARNEWIPDHDAVFAFGKLCEKILASLIGIKIAGSPTLSWRSCSGEKGHWH